VDIVGPPEDQQLDVAAVGNHTAPGAMILRGGALSCRARSNDQAAMLEMCSYAVELPGFLGHALAASAMSYKRLHSANCRCCCSDRCSPRLLCACSPDVCSWDLA
jgi:hypothetical protein